MNQDLAEFVALTTGLITAYLIFCAGLGWHEHGWKGAVANGLYASKILVGAALLIGAGVGVGFAVYHLMTEGL